MRRLGILLVAVALAGAGCGGGNRSKGAATPSPTMRESFENKLPREFPSDLPLPQGHKVLYSAVQTSSGNPVTQVVFQAPAESKQLRDFFVSELPKKGWRLVQCQDLQAQPDTKGPATTIYATKGKLIAFIIVGELGSSASERLKGQRISFTVHAIRSQKELTIQSPVPGSSC